jgi:hypothetical protein
VRNSHKGLDTEIYQKIYTLAKQNRKRVSDLINEALKVYIQSHDGPTGLEPKDPIIENAGFHDTYKVHHPQHPSRTEKCARIEMY